MKDVRLQVIAENFRPSINVVHGRPTPPEERDKAYAVWAWGCNRNIKRTAEAIGVDRNTVAGWARQDEWALRWEQEVAETSPQSQRMLAFLHLANNTYRAATVVSETLGLTPDEYADLIMQHIDAAGGTAVPHDELRAIIASVLSANHNVMKVRLAAAQDVLSRLGISVEAGLRLAAYAKETAVQPPDLSDEELFDSL
ncbi:MAG TPA: hypothetical protein VGW38_13850 [Chloroflexota bacterium]|nr:hypothetical protein [Chloroflexota bacterium]